MTVPAGVPAPATGRRSATGPSSIGTCRSGGRGRRAAAGSAAVASGSLPAQDAAGPATPLTSAASDSSQQQDRQRWRRVACGTPSRSRQPDQRLQQQLQHDRQDHRQHDRRGDVERRQQGEQEQSAEEDRARLGRERHVVLVLGAAGAAGIWRRRSVDDRRLDRVRRSTALAAWALMSTFLSTRHCNAAGPAIVALASPAGCGCVRTPER